MSESRAVQLVRFASDVLAHSGPQLLNVLPAEEVVLDKNQTTLSSGEHKAAVQEMEHDEQQEDEPQRCHPADFDTLFKAMLQDLEKEAATAHNIVERVARQLGGGGGSARKVIARLQTRPDFAQGIRHLLPLLKKLGVDAPARHGLDLGTHDESAGDMGPVSPAEAIAAADGGKRGKKRGKKKGKKPTATGLPVIEVPQPSPLELYEDFRAARREKRRKAAEEAAAKEIRGGHAGKPKRPGNSKGSKSPKNARGSPKSSASTTSTTNSGAGDPRLSELAGNWLMHDSQESFVRGRESWGVSLDNVITICLNRFLDLRRKMLVHLSSLFREHFDAKRQTGGASYDDFRVLLFSADPTVSDGLAHSIYDMCVDETCKETGGHRLAATVAKNKEGDEDSDSEDDEDQAQRDVEQHDDISLSAFLKTCIKFGLLRGWCRTFGKRPHTTGGQKARELQERKAILQRVKMLAPLNPRQIHKLAGQFTRREVSARTMLVKQGDVGDAFYVITAGQVDVWIAKKGGSRKWVATLGEGDFFGEKALLTQEPRNADCIAKSDVVQLLVLDKPSFDATLGPLEAILRAAAQEFTALYADWRDIHEPLVAAYTDKQQALLVDLQQRYRHAEQDYKAGLAAQIDDRGARIKVVTDATTAVLAALKSRADVAQARKAIHQALLVVTDGAALAELETSRNSNTITVRSPST